MKYVLMFAGIVALGIGMWAGFQDHAGALTVGFLGFVVLLFVANLDRISEFKASGTGIEAKTREVIAKAENTLNELQLLAKQVGILTLSLVKRSGRMGGYEDQEEESIKESVTDVLRQVGIKESEFPEILSEWHRFIEFDYAHAILGGSTIPDGVEPTVMEEWQKLRSGGIAKVPSPEQIRDFLKRHNLITDELQEYIKDYEHYRQRREHRRREVWRNRQNWGRLKKV